jgi:HTH-type transcriptional regulator, sugar sensing transcriptional regulator
MLENELQQLGLNDSESKIYLIALELGGGAIQELADQSGIKRGTVYNIIESLVAKNILKRKEKNKKKLLCVKYQWCIRSFFL